MDNISPVNQTQGLSSSHTAPVGATASVLSDEKYVETVNKAQETIGDARNKWTATVTLTLVGLLVFGIGGLGGLVLGFLTDTLRANKAENEVQTARSTLQAALGKLPEITKATITSTEPKGTRIEGKFPKDVSNVVSYTDNEGTHIAFKAGGKSYDGVLREQNGLQGQPANYVKAVLCKATLDSVEGDTPNQYASNMGDNAGSCFDCLGCLASAFEGC